MHYHFVLLILLFIILSGIFFISLLFIYIIIINNRFRTDTRELPVLWHQSLLAFVQNYRQDISTGLKIKDFY